MRMLLCINFIRPPLPVNVIGFSYTFSGSPESDEGFVSKQCVWDMSAGSRNREEYEAQKDD